jgi:hypothetical protein
VATHKRLLSFMNNDAKGRYEDLMRLYPELYNLVPKQLIAAYLGVSRETLSRLGEGDAEAAVDAIYRHISSKFGNFEQRIIKNSS